MTLGVAVAEVGEIARSMTVTPNVLGGPLPHSLEGVTEIVPPVLPTVTVMELVPCPLLMVHPAGTTHVKVIFVKKVTL
jgi:hypothetical protein